MLEEMNEQSAPGLVVDGSQNTSVQTDMASHKDQEAGQILDRVVMILTDQESRQELSITQLGVAATDSNGQHVISHHLVSDQHPVHIVGPEVLLQHSRGEVMVAPGFQRQAAVFIRTTDGIQNYVPIRTGKTEELGNFEDVLKAAVRQAQERGAEVNSICIVAQTPPKKGLPVDLVTIMRTCLKNSNVQFDDITVELISPQESEHVPLRVWSAVSSDVIADPAHMYATRVTEDKQGGKPVETQHTTLMDLAREGKVKLNARIVTTPFRSDAVIK
jgi:hypothetical protein